MRWAVSNFLAVLTSSTDERCDYFIILTLTESCALLYCSLSFNLGICILPMYLLTALSVFYPYWFRWDLNLTRSVFCFGIKLTFVPCNCMGDLMTDAFSCDCSYLVIMTRYMTVSCLEGVVNDSVSDGTLSLNFIAFLPLISCTGRNVLTGIQYWYIS